MSLKQSFGKWAKRVLFPYLIYFFVRLLNLTYRYRYPNREMMDQFGVRGNGAGFLFACWHRNILGAIMGHIGAKHAILVSPSADGGLVAKTLELLGHKVVRGSSSRGGKEALIELIRLVKNGMPSSISVDGPKGPAQICKRGIIELSSKTGKPIVPMKPKALNAHVFEKSWDRFVLPKPFSVIEITYGEPIYVDPDLTPEKLKEYTDQVKSALDS